MIKMTANNDNPFSQALAQKASHKTIQTVQQYQREITKLRNLGMSLLSSQIRQAHSAKNNRDYGL